VFKVFLLSSSLKKTALLVVATLLFLKGYQNLTPSKNNISPPSPFETLLLGYFLLRPKLAFLFKQHFFSFKKSSLLWTCPGCFLKAGLQITPQQIAFLAETMHPGTLGEVLVCNLPKKWVVCYSGIRKSFIFLFSSNLTYSRIS